MNENESIHSQSGEPMKFTFINILRQLVFRFKAHDVAALGAQMSYYMILSVFPFLMLVLSIMANTGLSSDAMMANIAQIMPGDTGAMVIDVITETVNASTAGLISVSMLAALWTSSNGVTALMKGVNKAYDFKENRPFWKLKGVALLFTVGMIVMILVVVVTLVMGKVIGEQVFSYLDAGSLFVTVWTILRYLIPLISLIVTFMLFFRFAPSHRISRKNALVGALLTTFGWLAVSQLFSNYVSRFGNYTRVYGSIGGIIVFLIWLYISSIIILTGGEVNASIAYLRSNDRRKVYEDIPYLLPFLHKDK